MLGNSQGRTRPLTQEFSQANMYRYTYVYTAYMHAHRQTLTHNGISLKGRAVYHILDGMGVCGLNPGASQLPVQSWANQHHTLLHFEL